MLVILVVVSVFQWQLYRLLTTRLLHEFMSCLQRFELYVSVDGLVAYDVRQGDRLSLIHISEPTRPY